MYAYQVNDMTCGHCADAIIKAIHEVDGGASVEVDLGQKRVLVTPTIAASAVIERAIQGAGYEAVAASRSPHGATPSRVGGCCCGSGSAGCGASQG